MMKTGARCIKQKKQKIQSDGSTLKTCRHVLSPINPKVSFDALKTLASKMLETKTFQNDLQWMFASREQSNIWLCHHKLTGAFVKQSGFARSEMLQKERHCTLRTLLERKEAFGLEEIYVHPPLKEKAIGGKVEQKDSDKFHDDSFPSRTTGKVTAKNYATARSSEVGDSVSQKMIRIPVEIPTATTFLDPSVLQFLRYLIRDHWTIKQLKARFLKSGHDTIFITILNNESDLKLYENGVTEANEYLSENEQRVLAQKSTERDECIKKMAKERQVTTRIDDAFAEMGFDIMRINDQNSQIGNNSIGGSTKGD